MKEDRVRLYLACNFIPPCREEDRRSPRKEAEKKIPTPPSAQYGKSLHKVVCGFDSLKAFQSYTSVQNRK